MGHKGLVLELEEEPGKGPAGLWGRRLCICFLSQGSSLGMEQPESDEQSGILEGDASKGAGDCVEQLTSKYNQRYFQTVPNPFPGPG